MYSKELIQKLISVGIEESEARKELSILEKEVKDLKKIEEIINKRIVDRTPLQYLLGKAYFMDFEVSVNKNVLIPRPETELLIEELIKRIKNENISILDIGTGSGIIPIALAKRLPKAKITTIDINKEIIELAKENAIKNGVSEKINFKICDVFSKCFEGLIDTNSFDLIVSNPPYIKDESIKALSPEVRHEPKEALSGNIENKNGIKYYERILSVCKSSKLIAFEIDPPILIELESLLKKHQAMNYNIIKDYSKFERCLFINN